MTTIDPETGVVDHLGLLGRLRYRLGPYSPLVRAYRHHKPRWLWGLIDPVGRMTLRFQRSYGLTVRHGPFAGLRYPPAAVGRSGYLVPKLLGTYESALHDVMQEAGRFSHFIDIGASDGYYCVGIALLNPGAVVVGYETDRVEQSIAKGLAALNGVDIEVRGTAGRSELASLPASGALLMVDIEGAERELLDPSASPRLRTTTMLVETHLEAHPDLVDVLTSRFSRTHEITVIGERRRSTINPAELADWDPEGVRRLMTEGRLTPGVWMLLRPKS